MAQALIKPQLTSFLSTTSSGKQVTELVVDVTRTEQHNLENEITDHPVEQGVNISDHCRPLPDLLVLDCIISNTPVANSGGSSANAPEAANDAYDTLKDLRDNGTLLSVITSLRTYSSMVVKHVSIPRTAENVNGLIFTITFKYIRVVKNKLTTSVVAKAPQAQPKSNKGHQTPVSIPNQPVNSSGSQAVGVFDSLAGRG